MSARVQVLCGHLTKAEPQHSRTALGPQPCSWLGKADQRWIKLDEVENVGGMRMSWIPEIGPIWCAWLAVKQILHIKNIPVVLVHHQDNDKLYQITAQRSFPVLWWEDERPRSAWLEQVTLADRVGAGPKLIPEDAAGRIEMFGVLNELLGNEDGFCTHKRQMAFTKWGETMEPAQQFTNEFVKKYQFVDPARAPRRVVEVLNLLDGMLIRQAENGSKYLIGRSLTVLDIYAAASVAVMAAPAGSPMGPTAFPREMFGRKHITFLMDYFAASTADHQEIVAAFTPRLQAHRDFIMASYFEKTETYFPK